MARWPVVGRERAVDVAAAQLRAGTGVALTGRPGMGKSAIAAEVAAGSSAPAVWLRPVSELQGVPLGALALLLGTGDLDPARAASGLAELVGGGLLVVDDAHDLDGQSAAVVHQLATVQRLPLLITCTDGRVPPDAVTRLWKDGTVRRYEIGPLDAGGVAAMAAAVLGGTADPALVDEVVARTLGAPLYVRELLLAARDNGAISWRDGRWRSDGRLALPAGLADVIGLRLDTLDPAARRVHDLVALVGAVSLDLVDESATAELERRGLVVVDDLERPLVRAAHPFVAEVAAGAIPVAARRSLLR
nr:hypothetical protein [Acidimicrobiia bacterium]